MLDLPDHVPERIRRRVYESDDGCWLFTGFHASGYARIQMPVGGVWKACGLHRVMYELLIGPIPEGLVIDHLCRNRGCVNPAHMEPVSSGENVLRGVGPGALNALKTHCPQRHPYSTANTYVTKEGFRQCRICKTEKARLRRTR